MRKLFFLITACLLLLPAAPVFASPTITVTGLSNAGTVLDGQEVDFTGEAVGDIINADSGHKWLTIHDSGSSISVYVSDADAQKVTALGRYGQTGTTLEIVGVFHLACDQHDGLSDVHAASVTVINAGAPLEQHPNLRLLIFGGVLIIVGILLFILHNRLQERVR